MTFELRLAASSWAEWLEESLEEHLVCENILLLDLGAGDRDEFDLWIFIELCSLVNSVYNILKYL